MTNDKADTLSRMKFDALMTEYQQLYEQSRHDKNIALTVQGLLVTISFGILAYSIQYNDIPLYGLILAALLSLIFYTYYLFYFQQIDMIISLRYERISKIASVIDKELDCREFGFARELLALYEEKRDQKSFKKWHHYANPFNIVTHFSNRTESFHFRVILFFVLVVVWIVRVIQYAPHSTV